MGGGCEPPTLLKNMAEEVEATIGRVLWKGVYRGLREGGLNLCGQRYPIWLYHDDKEPLLVNDDDGEKEARLQGYDSITAADMSNKHLINWFWDLEDMSPRQLQIFAKEEYSVDLPIEAGQEKLFKAIVELTRAAPQNQNCMVFMAHTIKMNYDETLNEIRRMIEGPPGTETENFYKEVIM